MSEGRSWDNDLPGSALIQQSQEVLKQCPRAVARWHWLLCTLSALDDSLPAETPRPDHARRAVDVNWPLTPRCVPAATLAARLQAGTGGLTSPARLYRFFVVLDRKPMPLGCRHAAHQADGRKPPVAIRTEGARAAERVASALSAPFARGLPPNGIGFPAGGGAGRAKLLLSRIPAASVAPIPAAQ
jgi:hypothetical protein